MDQQVEVNTVGDIGDAVLGGDFTSSIAKEISSLIPVRHQAVVPAILPQAGAAPAPAGGTFWSRYWGWIVGGSLLAVGLVIALK
jgi:hypothetical protein